MTSDKTNPSQNGTTPTSDVANAGAVTISVSSFNLAEDCSEPSDAKATSPTAEQARPARGPAIRTKPACDQSSLQLQLVAAAQASATTFALQKVELLDGAGKLLGELTPRSATQWMPTGVYAPWDQTITSGASIKASYMLSAPTWPAYGLTRSSAAGQMFRLRVTVAAHGNNQVVTSEATILSLPTPIQPAVPT